MDYTYTAIGEGNDKNLRLTSVEYPSGRDIYYNYPSSGIGAVLNRLDNIASSATPDPADKYAAYTYLGAGTVVKVTHPAVTNGLELTYISGAGAYGGLDRFGRVVDQKWQNTAATTTHDRYQYGYDAAGNRLYKENVGPSGKDELYAYDGLEK